MISLIRTDAANADFRELVAGLDRELQHLDGDDHPFYAQFNQLDDISHVVVAYIDSRPAGCGAIKPYSDKFAEVKRMYVPEPYRKQGVATSVLYELEKWACELGFTGCLLETGMKQPAAIALYHKWGFNDMPNYGQYAGVENSVCMNKLFVDTPESNGLLS